MSVQDLDARVPDSARARLLQSAGLLFARRGFEGASTRAIAEHAGAHQALVRHHFGSKEALWREVIERGLSALGAEVERAGPDTDRTAALLRAAAAHPEAAQIIVHALLEPGERRAWLLSRLAPLHARSFAWLTGTRQGARGARDELRLCLCLAVAFAPWLLASALHEMSGRKLDPVLVLRAQQEALASLLGTAPPAAPAGAWSLAAAQRRRLQPSR